MPPADAVPDRPPELDALVRADLANAVQRNVVWLILGNVLVVGEVAWLFWAPAPSPLLLGWVALQLLHSGLSLAQTIRLRRRPAHTRNASRRLRVTSWGMAVAGTLWGVGVVALWPLGDTTQQLLLLLLAATSAAATLNALVGWLPASYGFVGPCVGGIVVASLLAGSPALQLFAAVAVFAVVVNLLFARQMHDTLREALRNRRQVSELAARLAQEKQRAEEANQSKSRFLAAASHDLRQPVHALSLFVAALRERPQGPQAGDLVGRIDTTVTAMAGMFNALLDMSRLDAGMVQVQAADFELEPLLRRLGDEAGAVAASRGLRLDIDVPPLRVHTDPQLLERIVRNLLANAVRYTDAGGVRIQARVRAGRARLRFADSGAGIARGEREHVFEEFYQGHNPERDRNKGLGLGLAIVRRLCLLLGVGLRLRSRPGRGSVFSLDLPLARGLSAAGDAPGRVAAPLPGPSGRLASGDLVLVIDDDDEIRAGMRTLLEGWGSRVVDAPDLMALRERLAGVFEMPRLAICDHRLRGGATGLQVIEALKQDYNDPLPCILVTGDTAPERLHETSAAGVLLLHKPVDADRLRDAVAMALAGTAIDASG